MKATTNRKQIEALPAVMRLRQAAATLRSLDAFVDRVREDGRIILARAAWHLDNRVAEIYQLEIERKEN